MRQERVNRVAALIVLAMIAIAACSATSPRLSSPATARVTVRQVWVGRHRRYIEGALPVVELYASNGTLIDRAEDTNYVAEKVLLTSTVLPDAIEVRSYVLPCDANCGRLDDPNDACSATIDVVAGQAVEVRVERSAGLPCVIRV